MECGAVSKTYQGIEAHELVRQLPRGNGHTARGPPRRHPALFFCLQKESVKEADPLASFFFSF